MRDFGNWLAVSSVAATQVRLLIGTGAALVVFSVLQRFRRVRQAQYGIVLLGVLAAASGYAALLSFTTFRDWDDEGFMMVQIRHMLDGFRVYDDVGSWFGPAYYGLHWVLHRLLHVPLTNDAMRFVSITLWISAAGVLAYVVYGIHADRDWAPGLAALVLGALVLYLSWLANEPGHPQGLCLFLVAGGALAACFSASGTGRAAMLALGVIGGTLLLTKLNVGVFFLAAAALALTAGMPRGIASATLRYATLAGALLLPVMVLRPSLHDGWARQFGISCLVSVMLCWLAAMRKREGPATDWSAIVRFAAGAFAAGAVLLGVALAGGNSIAAIVRSLVIKPTSIAGAFGSPIAVSRGEVHWLIAGAACCALWLGGRGGLRKLMEGAAIPAIKLVLAAAVLGQILLLNFLPGMVGGWPSGFAAGFLWLTLVAPAGREPNAGEAFLRRLVTFVGALQVLQMYPVPGTQCYVGTALFPVMAMVWLGDAIVAAEAVVPKGRARRWSFCALAWVLGLWAFVATAAPLAPLRDYYQRLESPGFRGCRLTKMTPTQASIYRSLADTLRKSGDTFVCNTGLNSLYFWAECRPASPLAICETLEVFDAGEQARLLSTNRALPKLIFIRRPWILHAPNCEIPLLKFLESDFRPIGQIPAGNRVYAHHCVLEIRSDRRDLRLRSCVRAPAKAENRELVELEFPWRGEAKPMKMQFQLVQVSLPPALGRGRITHIEFVDLALLGVLAKTRDSLPHKQLMVLDAQRRVIMGGSARGPVDPRGELEALWLAIPSRLDFAELAIPAVRLYRGSRRLATLPLAFVER